MFPSIVQRFAKYSALVVAALIGLLVVGCGVFPESSFSLASESRLPKWFDLPPGQTRESVAITMDYFVNSSGRTTAFAMRDSSGKVIAKATGTLKGPNPLQRAVKSPDSPLGYPSYEIVTVGEHAEVIEHRKMEPVFYVTDDPSVLDEFGVHR